MQLEGERPDPTRRPDWAARDGATWSLEPGRYRKARVGPAGYVTGELSPHPAT